MDELPLHSPKRFRGALGDALRRRRGDEMGDFSKSGFAREVASRGPWSFNTVLGYVKGARRPTPAVLEAMADALDLPAGGAYFREYRRLQMEDACDRHPELEDVFYEQFMEAAARLDEKAKLLGDGGKGAT